MATVMNPPKKGRNYHYSNISDLKNISSTDMTNPDNQKYWDGILERNQKKDEWDCNFWFGPEIKTYQEFQNALNSGWGYGMKQVETMTSKIKMPALESVKRKTVRGRNGDNLDIHRVNRGEFDRAWSKRKRMSRATKKRFTLTANIGANCDVDSSVLFWRGVATVSLAKALIVAGHAVEIVAFTSNNQLTKENAQMFHTVTVKTFDSPLNLASLVAVICLAGFFRTEIFKAWLADPETCRVGLGHAVDKPLPEKILNHNGQIIQVPNNLKSERVVEYWLNDIASEI